MSPSATPQHWTSPRGMKYLGPHTDSTPLTVTLVMRRRQGAQPQAALFPQRPRWPRGEFGRHAGGEPADLARLRSFARQYGLQEVGADLNRRVLHLSGAPHALERAFAVTLGQYQLSDGRGSFIASAHAPTLPPEAIAVLGLDRRPVARAHSRRPKTTPSVTYTPLQLGALYAFPAATDGSGETIAIIELGGGFQSSDLAQYFAGLGIAKPPTVTAVSVAGGSNQPGGDADGEVMLDI